MKKLLGNSAKPVAAAILLAALSGPALAQMPPPPPHAGQRSIHVQGEAKGEFEPDQAVIHFSVVSRDKALEAAKKANDATMQRVLAVTQSFDIPKEKVVTSGVYIAPEYHHRPNSGRPELRGYTVNRNLHVTIRDLSRQEALLSAIVDTKVDQVNHVEFQLSDPEKFASEVRVRAFANAKARAAALAEAAGAKLGPALVINTTGSMHMPHPPMPMMAMAERSMAADGAPSVAPTLPGTITLQETVNVVFALE